MKSSFRIVSLCLVLIVVLSAIGSVGASNSSLQDYQGGSELDGLSKDQPTYYIFYDETFTYSYSGGPVCLSSQDSLCKPMAIDDEGYITVNGEVLYYASYTKDFGPINLVPYLHTGSNNIRVQLVDRMGPNRGGSSFWVVGASIPTVRVSIERDGDSFSPDGKGGSISIEGQPRANVPFKVTVTKDGKPVIAELQQLQPFDAYGGATDSNGVSKGSVAISIPPQVGDVKAQYQATIDGITATSEPYLLYRVGVVYGHKTTLTSDDVKSWGDSLFRQYTLDRPLNAPDIFHWQGSGNIIDLLITILKVGASYVRYSPQVGDEHITTIYSLSAPDANTIYLLRQAIIRSGSAIAEYNYFSSDLSKVDDVLDDPLTPTHEGLEVVAASPVTFFITDPHGLTAGVSPTTEERVFNFPLALDQTGEEPYRAFIPSAIDGRYLVHVVGTGDGPYTFSTYSLTDEGLATPTLSVSGLTHLGYVTNFVINYQFDTAVPVSLAIVGTTEIKPDTLNLASMSGPNSVTTFVELPLGFDVRQIDQKTVMLDSVIPAQLLPSAVSDYNNNGILDLMVKFDRKLVINYLKSNNLFGQNVALTVTGNYLQTVQFTATDTITVLKK